jgi:hypothetical protein
MAETSSSTLTVIPTQLRNQLPIFQVLGDKLPAPMKTPEGKKTVASVFYWILILGGAAWFVLNIDNLLTFAEKSIRFVIFAIALIVLLMLAPKIISFLNRAGSTILFKSEKAIVRNNPVIALQMLLQDAKDTLKRVKDKIAHVDGVRIDMIQSGTQAQQTAQEKYALVKRIVADAGKKQRPEPLCQRATHQGLFDGQRRRGGGE